MFFYVERFCLSCHGDALWADTSGGNRLCWLILLLHVCMCSHVAHINTHTHAHTDQCTVWCLWRMGVAYWTSTSATQEHCHAQKYFTKRGAWAPENKMVRHLCPKWPLDELTGCVFPFFFYSQHNAIHSLQVSRQSDGYERENFHVIFLAQNHASFLSFFFFKLDQEFFLLSLLLFKAKFSCISVSAQDLIDLWFFYLALLFSKELIRWWDCIPLNLNVPVWKLFSCCAD